MPANINIPSCPKIENKTKMSREEGRIKAGINWGDKITEKYFNYREKWSLSIQKMNGW